MVKSLRFADGVEVPVPGFGAMGISFALGNNLSYEEAEPVLLKALELSCTFWDTAVGLIPNKCPEPPSSLTSTFDLGLLRRRRKREDLGGFYQEAQLPRQNLSYVPRPLSSDFNDQGSASCQLTKVDK